MTSMRRARAILLILSLLAAPLAVLARGNACCDRPCCSQMCCPLKAGPAAHHGNASGMVCHRHSGPAPDCVMKSACNHTLDYGFASPLPPTLLPAASAGERPVKLSSPIVHLDADAAAGFLPSPFEPPRS